MSSNFKENTVCSKEKKYMHMIRTERYKNYGPLEDQAVIMVPEVLRML